MNLISHMTSKNGDKIMVVNVAAMAMIRPTRLLTIISIHLLILILEEFNYLKNQIYLSGL